MAKMSTANTFKGSPIETNDGFRLIRVGYVPNSQDLGHPADRRRLAFWAHEKNLELNVKNPLDSDILILSGAANY